MCNIAVAGAIAVHCMGVGEYTCGIAAKAVDAWNEAAGRQLFEMASTHTRDGRKVFLATYASPQGDCGLHGVDRVDDKVSLIHVNTMNIRCRLLTTLLHELGHVLGLQHDLKLHSLSVMRERNTYQSKPAPIDIERLNELEKERERLCGR